MLARGAMNIEVLRVSFESLEHGEWDFTPRFYAILFSRYPELRALFENDMQQKQQTMLYQALAAIMDHLDNAFWLKESLMKYGARHAKYGITDQMYDRFGECLLATLSEFKGSEWTPPLAQAWSEAYDAISKLMKAGAAAAARPG
jgi:hemoglobin-like flavoprotein